MDYNKVAALYIATLKGLALVHQNSHWLTKGETFYGDHLLFERLYKSTLENLDLAAEKFIGVLGDACLDYDAQADLLHKVLLKYRNLEGSPVEMSLVAEKDFLKLSQDAYQAFEDEGKMTLGLDDMIMAIASKREEAVYLLQQTLKGDTLKNANKRQQILTRLAQAMAESTSPNEEAGAQKFVQNMTAAWLANNVQKVAYRTVLKKSESPQFHYEIELVMAPASPAHKIAPDVPAKYKEYMAQKLLEQPFLSSKVVKIDPQIVSHL